MTTMKLTGVLIFATVLAMGVGLSKPGYAQGALQQLEDAAQDGQEAVEAPTDEDAKAESNETFDTPHDSDGN